MIVGREPVDSGNLRVGENGPSSPMWDQGREGLDPTRNVWEVVSDGLDYIRVGQVEMPSRAYESAFGFKGPANMNPSGVLSGGERNRLNLALPLKQGGNHAVWTSRPTTWTWRPWGSLRTPCWSSPAAPS
jgi:ATPase subunit of ABC transporter with duplicated ATPase domains